jgi:hypothetical protein
MSTSHTRAIFPALSCCLAAPISSIVVLANGCRKHGTFRPTLLSLVSSNPDATISSLTATVFSEYDSSLDSDSEPPDIPSLVSRLTALKGVGPATASLLLSSLDPDRVPFFGDELFRWAMWDAPIAPGKSGHGAHGKGWKRKIGYNAKEYTALVDVVERARTRLGVTVSELERVGFVLGKEALDIEEGLEDSDDTTEEIGSKGANFKRKASFENDQENEIADATRKRPREV